MLSKFILLELTFKVQTKIIVNKSGFNHVIIKNT